MSMPRELLSRAASQEGLLSRADLRSADVDRHRLARLKASGLLVPVGRRTFRLAGSPETERQELRAALLETGGAIGARSSSRVHGLGTFARRRPPEVLVRRSGHDYTLPAAEVHTTTWLPADDLVVVDGFLCTGIPRTLFSLAALAPEVPLSVTRGLVDQAVREGKASDAWLWWRLEQIRCRGRRGVAAFESILAARLGGTTESWLEREFLTIVERAGLPLPACQRRIMRRGAFVGRVDFLYEQIGVVIEVTGHAYHSTPGQRMADARRRNQLQLAGFTVIEFTYDDVVRAPDHVVAELRDVLGLARRRTA